MRRLLFGVALLAASFAAAEAATVAVFTDRTAFLAALASFETEDLNGVGADISFNGADATVGALTFRNDNGTSLGEVDAPDPEVQFPGSFDIDGTTLANFFVGFDSATIALAEEVTAFGADWASLNGTGSQIFSAGGAEISPAPASAANGVIQFYGFISDMPFSTVTISGVQNEGDGFSGDNFVFGAAVVPLPASLPLLLTGLALVVAGRRLVF